MFGCGVYTRKEGCDGANGKAGFRGTRFRGKGKLEGKEDEYEGEITEGPIGQGHEVEGSEIVL